MQERIVNIFTYGDDEHIHSIGWQTHLKAGSYQELTIFLQSRVDGDHKKASRFDLAEKLPRSAFDFALRLNALQHVVPRVVEIVGDSVYCVTDVVNGKPQMSDISHAPPHEIVPDYLRLYWTKSGFDFGQMIDDDFMDAIKILWDDEKYISALKLLVIMIDTLGFVEFGPVHDAFIRWLDRYCDLRPLGVSSSEIWELRNSLLHMTNLSSRKVSSGEVERLLPIVTAAQNDIPIEMDDFKCLHLSRLFGSVVPFGIANWVRSFDGNPNKVLEFVQRYDTVISDSRRSVAHVPQRISHEEV